MSFIEHTSCDNCGSSDGRAVYQGGSSWCFVCHTYKRGNIFHVPKKKEAKQLPSDLSYEYGPEVIEWISKYGISVEDLIREDISYSKYRGQLVFSWKDEEGNLLGWQARNFRSLPKYTSSGNLDDCLPIYVQRKNVHNTKGLNFRTHTNSCCLVEDCLSAIKASKTGLVDAMPCLTSSLSTTKLKRLAGLYGAFLVWLDGNMFDNAQKMARQLQLMGCEARAIYTVNDPKCYSVTEITNILLTNGV
jgi:hypothetical protein